MTLSQEFEGEPYIDSAYDTGLHLDDETERHIQKCLASVVHNFYPLKTLFGPLTRQDRVNIPPILFRDTENGQLRIYGSQHPERYTSLIERGYYAISSIGFDQLRDVIVVNVEGGRIANLDKWAAVYKTPLGEFIQYCLIEELTHSILLKYPRVGIVPDAIEAAPETYVEIVKRAAQLIGDRRVYLDPPEFWVGFSENFVNPAFSKINNRVLKEFLRYLEKLESGQQTPDKYYLRYAVEHLTTRAAFDLIKQNGGVNSTLERFPDILTCPQEALIENYVLPVKYSRGKDLFDFFG